MTVWSLHRKDKTACIGRMRCRYYTKYKIMTRLLDWHMYNATIHISTWKQRKLTQRWQKFSFNAPLLKWTQRVTPQNRVRVCRSAVHFSLRHEIVKVFQKREEQLVLILCVCVCVSTIWVSYPWLCHMERGSCLSFFVYVGVCDPGVPASLSSGFSPLDVLGKQVMKPEEWALVSPEEWALVGFFDITCLWSVQEETIKKK